MAVGGWFATGHHYGHLHQRIADEYGAYLSDWEGGYRADFEATSWELLVGGLAEPLPMTRVTRAPRPPKKTPRTTHGSLFSTVNSTAADGAALGPVAGETSTPAGEGEGARGGAGVPKRRSRRGALAGMLVEFKLDALLQTLHPMRALPLLDRGKAKELGLWRPLTSELAKPVELKLRVTDPWVVGSGAAAGAGADGGAGAAATEVGAAATDAGVTYELPLGTIVFHRERAILAGGEGRCVHHQHGVWHADKTCTVTEVLAQLCVKVKRKGVPSAAERAGVATAPLADGEDPSSAAAGDSAGDTAGGVASTPSHAAAAAAATTGTGTGRYELDLSFGGPGCTADGGWEAGEWRRVPRAAHVNGKSYLPNWGRNITTVVVRHSHDPEVLQRHVVKRLTPSLEQQILFHAMGLALCFLGAVLIISVAALGFAHAKRRALLLWHRLRGRRYRPAEGRGSDGEREEAFDERDGKRAQ